MPTLRKFTAKLFFLCLQFVFLYVNINAILARTRIVDCDLIQKTFPVALINAQFMVALYFHFYHLDVQYISFFPPCQQKNDRLSYYRPEKMT